MSNNKAVNVTNNQYIYNKGWTQVLAWGTMASQNFQKAQRFFILMVFIQGEFDRN